MPGHESAGSRQSITELNGFHPRHRKEKRRLPSSTRPHLRRVPPSNSTAATDSFSNSEVKIKSTSRHLPSQVARRLIRRHHTLAKNLNHALRANDAATVKAIRADIERDGGLKKYQQASLSGQRKDRGGDTSVVLVNWLHEASSLSTYANQNEGQEAGLHTGEAKKKAKGRDGLRMLEVGSLSLDSACARSGLFSGLAAEEQKMDRQSPLMNTDILDDHKSTRETQEKTEEKRRLCRDGGIFRIDLHSQATGIREIDFMEMELPLELQHDIRNNEQHGKKKVAGHRNKNDASDSIIGEDGDYEMYERKDDTAFDIVSLSLVVNFVGEPKARGDMLKRVSLFLRNTNAYSGRPESSYATLRDPSEQNGNDDKSNRSVDAGKERLLPALFLVLPAPCVTNSRYLSEERLTAIMQSLGYSMVRRKMSLKLVYYLWRFDGFRKRTTDTEGQKQPIFGKEEIRGGKNRNNFAIVLK